MPVEGIPDRDRHRLCIRCRKWHEQGEGELLYPEAAGPISGMRRTAAVLADDESAMRFLCFRCMRVRRYTKAILFGSLVFLVLLVLLLERLGVLH
jgi:hypothetical protein